MNAHLFRMFRYLLTILLPLICLNARADDASDLAKAAQNPVADMISLPFQDNVDFGFGPYDRTQNVLNIQPVIPINLNDNWNLISRIIMPVISQPDIANPTGYTNGLGDINPTFFLSPAKPGKIIWGIGPALLLPTATSEPLGTEKWGAGPSLVVLTMPGHWVIGFLVNNIWSFAGNANEPSVNQLTLQYFINYNLPKGWYLTSSPILTANWTANSGNVWTVPFGGGVGKIFKIGRQPLNASLLGFYNVVKPDIGPDWSLRFQLQFLFPRKA